MKKKGRMYIGPRTEDGWRAIREDETGVSTGTLRKLVDGQPIAPNSDIVRIEKGDRRIRSPTRSPRHRRSRQRDSRVPSRSRRRSGARRRGEERLTSKKRTGANAG